MHEMKIIALDPSKLCPSPANKRQFHEDDAADPAIVSLAESINQDGQIEPILVRPKEAVGFEYEIVCGERRTRACKLAGIEVYAIVREMDDKQAAMLTAAENAERENLNPLEEAATFAELVARGWTIDDVASHLKVPRSAIVRRMQLTELSELWQNAALSGLGFTHAWTASHYEKIARFPVEMQDLLFDDIQTLNDAPGWTTQEMVRYIGTYLHAIEGAPWKQNDETLVPSAGACRDCRKRSDCQGELFEEDELAFHKKRGSKKSGAQCLDDACWNAKQAAYVKAKEAELKQKHGAAPVILSDHKWGMPNDSEYKSRAMSEWEVQRCKATDPGAKAALYVDGPRAGQTEWVRPQATNSRSGSGETPKAGGEKSLEEKRAGLELLRLRIVAQKIRDAAWNEMSAPEYLSNNDVLALLEAFGTSPGDAERTWERFDDAQTDPAPLLISKLYQMVVPVLSSELGNRINGSQMSKQMDVDFLRRTCWALGLEYSDIYAQACEEKPEPKSWAKGAEPKAEEPKRGKKGKGAAA